MKAHREGVAVSEPEPQSEKPIFPWPVSMGGVSALEPESEELMAHYRAHVSQYGDIADALHIPKFSDLCRNELTGLLGDKGAVALVEAVARLGNYADHKDHATMRKAVSRLLCKDGIKLPRGKRTEPGVLKLVADLTPVFLHYGLPCASSERSRLVRALRMIAEEIEIKGDPRDEIRRLVKKKTDYDRVIKRVIYEAVAKGLQSLKATTPP